LNDKIELELSAIGENLEQYVRTARADMIFWETVKPDHSPEDLVSKTLLWLHDHLQAGTKTLAVDANHAQARFTRYVQGKCRDLRKKKYSESSDTETVSLIDTVDEETFEGTMKCLEEVKTQLKPKDVKRLTRILEGEKINDIMPSQTQTMFRRRVRKVYNAL